MLSGTLSEEMMEEVVGMDLDGVFGDIRKVELLLPYIPRLRSTLTNSNISLLDTLDSNEGEMKLIVELKNPIHIDLLHDIEHEAGFNSQDPDELRILRLIRLFLALEIELDETTGTIGQS